MIAMFGLTKHCLIGYIFLFSCGKLVYSYFPQVHSSPVELPIIGTYKSNTVAC